MPATEGTERDSGFSSVLGGTAQAALTDASRWLPVSGELVHKRRPDAVRVKRWRMLEDDLFEVSTGWEHCHPIFARGSSGGPDLILAAESLRQCVILIAHTAYAVPLDAAFVMNGISLHLLPQHQQGLELSEVLVTVRCHDVRRRGNLLHSMGIKLIFQHRGHRIAEGTGDLLVLPPRLYRRFRNGRTQPLERVPHELVDPVVVGKHRAQDVLLSRNGVEWTVQADTDHPVLFDHPSDHLPGMLLLEAARQAVRAEHPELEPYAFTAVFHRYAEFDPAPRLALHRNGSGAVAAQLHQDGAPVCTVEFIV